MPRAILTKLFTFESAHCLPGHKGKCARPHGHSYRLEVAVRGPIKEAQGTSDDGMVIDLYDLKQIVQTTVIERLDHNDLNEILPCRTTAENVAHWIWGELEQPLGALLYRVRLWETATGAVEITDDDR